LLLEAAEVVQVAEVAQVQLVLPHVKAVQAEAEVVVAVALLQADGFLRSAPA
jgi:hypothetical protein